MNADGFESTLMGTEFSNGTDGLDHSDGILMDLDKF